MERGRKLTAERKELLDRCVQEEWPIRQMIAVHGFGTRTVKKHYPDYTGMSQSEAILLNLKERQVMHKVDTLLQHISPFDSRTSWR